MNTLLSGEPNKVNWLKILILTCLIGFLLVEGKTLFIPLSYGLLISFVLYPLCKWLEGKGVNRIAAITTGIVLVVLLFLGMILLLGWQFRSFLLEWPQVQAKLTELMASLPKFLSSRFGLDEARVSLWIDSLLKQSGEQAFSGLGTSLVSLLVNVFTIFIIPVYTFLILLYRQQLIQVVFRLFPKGQQHRIEEVIRLSILTYYNFIKGMIVVYATVGALNSIGLLLLGVPHALIFGFLTAIMTFIPYVGIIVASLLPITYAWLTYDSAWYPMGVVLIFAFVQYLEANVIFPWAVSHRLKLNTLMTLIVIIAGGILWGASGMILFVPFAAIFKLIADRIEGWETFSLLLGDGEKKSTPS
jgi:predicted PurR-regulated permease PerM